MQSSLWDWTAPDVHVNWVTLSDWKSSRVVPKFRKKAFAVGFVWKLTTGSVFRWWHQSFKEGQRVKKQQGRRTEQVTRLKLERWRDDGVKERRNRCVTDEELQAGKMKKQKLKACKAKSLVTICLQHLLAYIHHSPTANENTVWYHKRDSTTC